MLPPVPPHSYLERPDEQRCRGLYYLAYCVDPPYASPVTRYANLAALSVVLADRLLVVAGASILVGCIAPRMDLSSTQENPDRPSGGESEAQSASVVQAIEH